MTGHSEVLATLQSAVAAETHLNAQYRADWRNVKFVGAKKVAKVLHGFGGDAHCWVKKTQDRLLLLGGDLNYTVAPVVQAAGLTALFQAELALEMAIMQPYEQAVQVAMRAFDDTTRNLFEHLLKWHQKHVGWLEQQLRLIASMGEADYIGEKL